MARKKLPAYEEWKAPWEKSGEEFDAEKAKKLIYRMQVNENEALDKADAADARVTALQEDLTKDDKNAREEITRLQTENKELANQAQTAVRLRVALAKGLTEKQAARLQGETFDELSADADAYLEELNPKNTGRGDDEEGDDEGYDGDDGDEGADDEGETPNLANQLRSGFGKGINEGKSSFNPEKMANFLPRLGH